MFSRLRTVAAALLRRRTVEADLDDELRDHLERDVAHRVARGVPVDEARRAALADLGGVQMTKDDVRDVRGITSLDNLGRDLRFAFRRLLRQPAYAALTIATIAAGVGAATAVFTVVDGVLLKPLPFPAPDELVTVWQINPTRGIEREDVAPATFLDWHERVRGITTLSAGNPYSVALRGTASTDQVGAWEVSADFFAMLGTGAHMGRTFRAEDFHPGSAPVVVLDHGFWERRFAADPAIVGSPLTLDDRVFTVIGVMPPRFELPAPTSIWMPWIPGEVQRNDRFGSYIKVFGRLAPGVSLGEAQSEMTALAAVLERDYPRSNTGVGAVVVPLTDVLVGARRPLLWTLLAASVVLLLVTLANVSALQLTRLTRQRRETAIRAALGARRGALARPLVAESLLLAAVSGAAAVGVAWGGVRILHALGPADLPRMSSVALDARSVAIAVALTVCAALILSAISAGRLTNAVRFEALGARNVAGSRRSRRVRQLAVSAQLALSLVLLIGTSLLIRSFQQLLAADRGYDTAQVLSFTTWVHSEYPDVAGREQYARSVLERLRALPGVRDAAIGSALPLAGPITGETADIVMEGASVPEGEEPMARGIAVWPSYFKTLGIALRAGRMLDETDDQRAERVVVVNEAFVRRFSPDRDPVGRMVAVGLMGRATPRRIVGVVGDTRHARLEMPPEPGVYIPWLQQPIAAMTFIVRTAGDAGALAPAVTRMMFELDSRVAIGRLATLDALLDQHLRERRFLLVLVGAFAAMAVLLACIGVFGVTSQTVVERTREIGVRLALGASPGDITRQLVGEAGWLAIGGIVAGVALAALATRGITQFLYEVARFDVPALAAAVGVVGALALLAAFVPTRRAARTDPSRVLQEE